MLRTLAISSVLFAGAASVANADVFRWVDEHGSVHYSDQWVPGSEVIKSTHPHPPASSTVTADTSHRAEAPKPFSSSTTPASDDQNAKAVKKDVAKVREQQCKDAKERYDKVIEARRIYKPKQGNDSKNTDDREYLSDQEADAYRVKVRQEVQDYCGKAPS